MKERTLRVLEFNKILTRLAEFALTDLGRELAGRTLTVEIGKVGKQNSDSVWN